MKTFITLTFLFFIALTGVSCKKEVTETGPEFSEARYRIEITGMWKAPELGVPPGVHFTTVLGMVHSPAVYLWKENSPATKGVENVAEAGNPNPLLAEIDSSVTAGNAVSLVVVPVPPPAGTSAAGFYINTNYPCVSFITMLAPTPDWFTGLSSFRLFENNRWVNDTIVNLYAWDAGSEDGDVFAYDNPATSPQQPVHLLTPANGSVLANGAAVIQPVAIARFIKL